MPLFVLHPDAALRTRLSRMPGHPYAVYPLTSWDALRAGLRRSTPHAPAVVDPYGPDGIAPELTDLLRDFPSATVVPALPLTLEASADLHALLALGVADVIDLLRDDSPAALDRRLRQVRGRVVHRLLRRALPNGAPSRTWGMLCVAAEVVSTGGVAPELARALGIEERTVTRWFARADLPPPRRVLAWLRLLTAADLLDDATRSVASAARASGYAGASSLKSALLNFIGMPPAALRGGDAFQRVAEAFARDLFETREAARADGKPDADWLT